MVGGVYISVRPDENSSLVWASKYFTLSSFFLMAVVTVEGGRGYEGRRRGSNELHHGMCCDILRV